MANGAGCNASQDRLFSSVQFCRVFADLSDSCEQLTEMLLQWTSNEPAM